MARQTNEEKAREVALAEWGKLSTAQRWALNRSGGGPLRRSVPALVRRGLMRIHPMEEIGDGYYYQRPTPWGTFVVSVGWETEEWQEVLDAHAAEEEAKRAAAEPDED